MLISLQILGQQTPKSQLLSNAPALEFRQVSGIIQDSTGSAITGATVKLISAKDSVITKTDTDGIFIIENVKMPIFIITVTNIGYLSAIRKCLNNDLTKKIVLDPIVLKDQSYQLKQVNINGAPSIIYKTDTVEYRASDYKVPAYATVDELLKQMEGMEVGPDGTLIHQGQKVTKAKLNGKLFSGGDVGQAIQNLPASIVEKIQIVNDYGDQAGRTGIKDGDPTKTLNITTKADRSIGTIGQLVSQEGNNNRYNEQLSVQNINANRVISIIGNISSTVNGIASSATVAPVNSNSGGYTPTSYIPSTTGASVPGITHSGSPTLSFNDDWGTKLVGTGSYSYNFNNTNSISDNYGQTNSSIGPSIFTNNSTVKNNSKGHTAKFELDYSINAQNYLQINPTYDYSISDIASNTLTNDVNYFTTGFEHPIVNLATIAPTANYDYGITLLFVHTFKNPRRNISLQFGFTESNSHLTGNTNSDYRYYMDTMQNLLLKDSLSHLITYKTSNSKIYRAVITYVEPLSTNSQLEFTTQFRLSLHYNNAVSDTVLGNGQLQELTRLENIYNFSFTETRATVDYRYNGKKSNLSIGATIVPTIISGNQVNNNNNNDVSTSQADFRIIPVFRYSYSWSNTEILQISYSGTNSEPNFQEIQPFTDKSDPNNIIIGNPNLKATFINNVMANYNKYFPNDKFNISFNLNGKLLNNQIVTNILQVTEPITTTLNKTIDEITFVNLDGDKTLSGGYAISKQLDDRNFNLALNGNITYNYANAISNNVSYHTTGWDFNERLGPRINLNNNMILINPYIGYETNKTATNTLNATTTTIQIIKLAIDGKYYLSHNFQFNYSATKNFISGFPDYSINPLVINAGVEKRLLRSHNLAFTFNVYDLLHQNNFIQESVTPQSTTYTLSNTLSRYFLIGLKLTLQEWGGSPMHNGKAMKRRGDGSFIK